MEIGDYKQKINDFVAMKEVPFSVPYGKLLMGLPKMIAIIMPMSMATLLRENSNL